jgi:phage regulator Rha-like protein
MIKLFDGGDQTQQTMSSVLIAEITGKTHAHVMRDIKKLQEQVGRETIFGLSQYEQKMPTGGTKIVPMYELNKEQTHLLVTGYSAPLRLKVIRRLEELESKNAPKELTRLEILTMAIESERRAIEAESKVAILMHVNKNYTITEIAKEIGLSSAKKLNDILCEKKIQFKQNGTYVPYSQYSTQGYFDIKQEVLDNGHVIYHRRVTQIGRDFILNLFKNY